MNDCTDDIVIRIASYGEAGDLLRLALASKRFSALMEEAARRILLESRKSDAGVKAGAIGEWRRLKKRVAVKSGEGTAVEDREGHPLAAMFAAAAAAAAEAHADEEGGGEEEQEGIVNEALERLRPRTPTGFWEVTYVDEPSPQQEQEEEAEVEGSSWISLYRELELVRKFHPLKIDTIDLLGGEEQFHAYLERLWGPKNAFTKVSICGRGPELDALGVLNQMSGWEREREETEYVPPERIRKVFQAVSHLPYLQEIVIDPGYYTEDQGELASSRLCWLLSPYSKYRTLRVANLCVFRRSDVELLAEALASCKTIETLCIDPIRVLCKLKTLVPLVKAIADMPNLKRLLLTFDTFGDQQMLIHRFLRQAIPIFRGLPGIAVKDCGGLRHLPELSNCADINALI